MNLLLAAIGLIVITEMVLFTFFFLTDDSSNFFTVGWNKGFEVVAFQSIIVDSTVHQSFLYRTRVYGSEIIKCDIRGSENPRGYTTILLGHSHLENLTLHTNHIKGVLIQGLWSWEDVP